jgi:CelD/BcsL family acetyltransferase involved in cellulose biosynthesis
MVSGTRRLGELLPQWTRLAERRGNAFVTPEWCLAAARSRGAGWESVAAVAWTDGGDLRGLLPLTRRKGDGRPELALCSAGDWFHPVSEPADEEAVAAAVAPLISAYVKGRRVLALHGVEADASWWRTLSRRARVAAVRGPDALSPYIELGGMDWDEYLATRSGQLRNQLRRRMRTLRRGHIVTVRRTSALGEVTADLDTLLRLHAARWRERPGRSAMSGDRARRLHLDFATAAFERGWLRLYLLEVDGEAVAAWYGWAIGGRWSYYQAGFDPAWSSHSVGFLLFAETIREAIEEGAHEYDMLQGAEAFKLRFSAGSRRTRTVVLAARAHPSRLMAGVGAGLHRGWRRVPPQTRERITGLVAPLARRRRG